MLMMCVDGGSSRTERARFGTMLASVGRSAPRTDNVDTVASINILTNTDRPGTAVHNRCSTGLWSGAPALPLRTGFLYDEPHRDKKEDRVLWDNQGGNKHTNDTPLERGEH
jgi:hypothetical protein